MALYRRQIGLRDASACTIKAPTPPIVEIGPFIKVSLTTWMTAAKEKFPHLKFKIPYAHISGAGSDVVNAHFDDVISKLENRYGAISEDFYKRWNAARGMSPMPGSIVYYYKPTSGEAQPVKSDDFAVSYRGMTASASRPIFKPVVDGLAPVWVVDAPPEIRAINDHAQWFLYARSDGRVISWDLKPKPKSFSLAGAFLEVIKAVTKWACQQLNRPELQTAANIAASTPNPAAMTAAAAWQATAFACGAAWPAPNGDPCAVPAEVAPAPVDQPLSFWDQNQKYIIAGGAAILGILAFKKFRDRQPG